MVSAVAADSATAIVTAATTEAGAMIAVDVTTAVVVTARDATGKVQGAAEVEIGPDRATEEEGIVRCKLASSTMFLKLFKPFVAVFSFLRS